MVRDLWKEEEEEGGDDLDVALREAEDLMQSQQVTLSAKDARKLNTGQHHRDLMLVPAPTAEEARSAVIPPEVLTTTPVKRHILIDVVRRLVVYRYPSIPHVIHARSVRSSYRSKLGVSSHP